MDAVTKRVLTGLEIEGLKKVFEELLKAAGEGVHATAAG